MITDPVADYIRLEIYWQRLGVADNDYKLLIGEFH